MRRLDINDCHELLLDMAIHLHSICVSHDIPYYMLGGTMLGAVRHQGFIPWDDDMDFGIPRLYYKKFCEVAQKELPDTYRMLTEDNSDYAVVGIGKLSNTQTWLKEIYTVKTDEKLGVFLDVFPLDYTDSAVGIFSTNWYVRKLFKVQKLLFVDASNRSFAKRALATACQSLIKLKPTTIPHFIDNLMLKRKVKPELLANLYGAWAMKEAVDVKVMGKPCLYKFENIELYGPENAHAYLNQLYGNYMELPPEDKRHIHTMEVYSLSD